MKWSVEKLWSWLVVSKQEIPEQEIPEQEVPEFINDSENLLRYVFSPINIYKKNNTLKPNAFRPPADSEDLSVNRINYTTIDFCRDLGKKYQQPEKDRSFFGFASIDANNIRINNADVVSSPIKDENPFHADIKIGHVMVRGEQPDSEISERIKALSKAAKLHIDPNTESDTWEGLDIKE